MCGNIIAPEIPHKGTAVTVLCVMCKSVIAGASSIFQVVSSEIYPTVIRSLGYGAANTASKLGAVLAPIVIDMGPGRVTASYAIMSGLCFLCILAILSLRETRGTEMEDTLQEPPASAETAPTITAAPAEAAQSILSSFSLPHTTCNSSESSSSSYERGSDIVLMERRAQKYNGSKIHSEKFDCEASVSGEISEFASTSVDQDDDSADGTAADGEISPLIQHRPIKYVS
ncbi:solute carrier family 22 member 13-like [Aplysia californica]|uniref:Solute carrier family 22 member 13-like n=1 Tax=Aplysia californica TaxID=6500 RepID=A0ABM1W1V2_APLCA|nr:solute carrier family 22 member 13-like [Aplysia californica]